eukprot:373325-Prymnesium_polylepis.2
MGSLIHRTAMARLARVQATSHGHPVTSGFDSKVMHHYISWAAAELPSAPSHYTEQLQLLPAHSIHQYYERRTQDGTSILDGMNFQALTRADLADLAPAKGHWYL